ncbi:MAG TPA: hypothetical protein VFC93_00800 [Chloroflexota bacterium]|nr:hypothetical protein [Chloroflexota bacterium]
MTAPTIRPVATTDELAAAFDVATTQFAHPVTRTDRRCLELLDRPPAGQPLMLVTEQEGRIVGAALGSGGAPPAQRRRREGNQQADDPDQLHRPPT